MNFTCPCCFAQISIEAALESAAGRELMGVLATVGPLARPLAAYLGCFRSQSRALSWDRALKLVREVQALDTEPRALAAALSDTVESLRAKRVVGDLRPLKNHNYLKSVMKSTLPQPLPSREGGHLAPSPLVGEGRGEGRLDPVKGKRAQALAALQAWGNND